MRHALVALFNAIPELSFLQESSIAVEPSNTLKLQPQLKGNHNIFLGGSSITAMTGPLWSIGNLSDT